MLTTADAPLTLRCSSCGAPKPLSEFEKRPDSRWGRRSQCRSCRRPVWAMQRLRRRARRMRDSVHALGLVAEARDAAAVRAVIAGLLRRFRGPDPLAEALIRFVRAELASSNLRSGSRAIRALGRLIARGAEDNAGRAAREQAAEPQHQNAIKRRTAAAPRARGAWPSTSDLPVYPSAEEMAERQREWDARHRVVAEPVASQQPREECERTGPPPFAGPPGTATDADLEWERQVRDRRAAEDRWQLSNGST
jgi:hypothetical protein